VVLLYPVDKLRQVVPDGSQRLSGHGHNCGALGALSQEGPGGNWWPRSVGVADLVAHANQCFRVLTG
jgi:hypothetical protein